MVKSASEEVQTSTATLQRGKACLRCRKRKMRCDGVKPSCLQCLRAKKPEGCEYDDGRGKTRTQILRETITRLEQRVRELEDPEYTSPSITLFDPHSHKRSNSNTSSADGSPSGSSVPSIHSPFTPDSGTSPSPVWSLSGIPSPSPIPLGDGYPLNVSPILLEIFTPYRHKCGLEIHMGRFKESLTRPISQQRHPVLLNAIYLWASYISRPGPLSQHESLYLAKTLEALTDALQGSNRMLDAIQASSLLATYFLSNGRIVEGSYHVSAAASLAMQCGLHRRTSYERDGSFEPLDPFKLSPPKDLVEEGERISTFWQVYNLDRCWSVVLRKPPTIPDGGDLLTAIKLPWPQSVEEYEAGQLDQGPYPSTIRSFLDGQITGVTGEFSTLALRVKASALFEAANRLSNGWDSPMSNVSALTEEFQALDRAISRFIPTLIPAHQLDATLLHDKHALIVIHSLANAAMIHLCYRFSQEEPVLYEKSLRAAHACVNIIKHISDADFNFLDPIIGPCWNCAAEVLVRELRNREAAWPMSDTKDIRNELGTILFAMNALGAVVPLLNLSFVKLQKRLAEL